MTDLPASVDVAVIGMGLAGCVAAAEAYDLDPNATIAMFEKAPEEHAGGNSRVSGQALWIAHEGQRGAVEAYQRALNHPNPTPAAVLKTWADALVQLEPWIKAKADAVGADYSKGMGWTSLETISEFPELGSEAAVAYNSTIKPNPSGVWRTFYGHVLQRPAIARRYETPCTALHQDETGRVCAINVSSGTNSQKINVRRGVILACGGYEASAQMQRDFWGAEDVLPVGTPYNTGDGIRMLQKVGARLWHMRSHTQSGGNWPAIAVPGFDAAFLRNVVMPDTGWFEIAANHQRFYNEGYHHRLRHYHVKEHGRWTDAPHWRAQPVHMIMDQKTLDAGPLVTDLMSWNPVALGYRWSEDNGAEVDKGWVIKADSTEELAETIARPAEAMSAAISQYNDVATGRAPCPFGRTPETMRPLAGPPYFAVEIKPGIICSTGGGARNERAQVLDWNDEPIEGLYEAGELGSTFGNLYQNGGFLTEAMIFGRIAGREAVSNDGA